MQMLLSFCSFLVLLRILSIVYATILRLPCMKYADFDVFHMDKALIGHLIRIDNGLNDVQCMAKCIEHVKCRSYNIQRDKQVCELNAKAFGDVNTQLTVKPGWVYKSTDYNNKLVILYIMFFLLNELNCHLIVQSLLTEIQGIFHVSQY